MRRDLEVTLRTLLVALRRKWLENNNLPLAKSVCRARMQFDACAATMPRLTYNCPFKERSRGED